ncbi:XdhC family protein [Rivibacter subsaxonicus]|uniref:Xanthine dehydrogenase accessory factor n=1 Tax=Rivibacter subsaxonicus TaxID=457575 RepID=A0A4Q7W0N9_9BURK|nr:XdhC family protein [Rivibacter subsaxonicus]RZU02670.1 xanthine dehydrogenase accessory factor [Rivibacter subsaxonicus]
MDNVDLQVLREIASWRADGQRAVLGTITRTWGSAPRPIGSLVAVRGDGRIAGSVSGGCIEDDLIERIQRGALALTAPERVRYGVSAEEATRFGLPCGGTLELVLEPIGEASQIEALLARLAAGERVQRRLDLATGAVTLAPAPPGATLVVDDATLLSTHGPSWRLLLIGAGQMSTYLAEMARALDYEVLVCDPREEHAGGFGVAGARLLKGMPDDVVRELRPDGHTAVIALTHDPKLDDLALMEALASDAFYVGAIGSRLNQAKRRERLSEHFGISEAQLQRLHGPVGIRNGARTPPEIAVAILAELTAERYGYRIPEPLPPAAASGPEAGCSL